MIEDGNGEATVTTVQGGELTLMLEGENVIVEDAQGNLATVTKVDVMRSNGVVHVVDTILMPQSGTYAGVSSQTPPGACPRNL